MEDVELDGGHAVEGALDHSDGLEVAAAIDHETTPAEARRVVNCDGGNHIAAAARLHELNESFETVHGAKLIRGIDLRARSV